MIYQNKITLEIIVKINTNSLTCFALIAALTGCASMSVSNDAIEKNTAFALGVEKGTFSISNREDDGVKSTYLVTTKSGDKYSCYVTGSISVVGKTVSDAICTPISKEAKQIQKVSTPASCNALLKAAGKC